MFESAAFFFQSWDLFRDSVLSATLAGALLGWMGVYIILRRMVFLSAALSQTASFGVVVSFYLALTIPALAFVFLPSVGAALLTLVVVLVLAMRNERHSTDSWLGVAFLFGASGTLLLGTRIVEEIHDVQTILFGTAVAVLPRDFLELVIVATILGAVHLVARRGFVAVALDRDDAMIRGMPTRTLEVVLLITLALGISSTTRILGALPAFAFSVLPAMVALRLCRNVDRALVMAAFVGAFCGFAGYLFAFLFEFPVGASQTFIGVLLVAFSEAFVRVTKSRWLI